MKKLLFVTFMVMFVFSLSNGLYSQSSVDEDDGLIEEEKPQTQPAKKYDLTPTFYKDMTWKEKVEISTTQTSSYSNRSETYQLNGNAKVTGLKDNKPTEFVISDFGGKVIRERLYHRDESSKTSEDDVEGIELKFTVDSAYKMKADIKKTKGAAELLLFYPAGNLLGYEVPTKAIGVDDTWSSTTLAPLNFHLIEDMGEDISISIVKSEFKLTSVTTKNNVEIATISWTGSCSVNEGRGNEDATVEWKRTIEFDLTNKRVLTTKGSFTVDVQDEDESIEFKSSRTLVYESVTEKKDETPKIQPKDDDE